MPAVSFLYNASAGEIIRNSVFSLFYSLGLLYLLHFFALSNKLDYDNYEHPYRFLIIFSGGLTLSFVLPLIDKKAWPVVMFAIVLCLFSNAFTAAYCVFGFLLYAQLLSGGEITTFFVYLFASMVGIILFQNIEDNFKVTPYLIISGLIMLVTEIAGFVLLLNDELSFDQVVIPVVNVVINILGVAGALKYFNQKIANRYRDKYLELNDQEYKALIELKDISKDEYFRSIHTAYLAERMANAIGCDVYLTKNCAYYHRIKKVFQMNRDDCEKFVSDNGFPPKAAELLLSFLDESQKLISKESGIVYLSDKFISTITALFKQDRNIKIDYNELVSSLFNKDFVKDTLSESELTYKDFNTIKAIILKETLYYDFLR